MSGWPNILSRIGFGPIMKNAFRIRNPETNLSAEMLNAFLWQLAGMNGVVPRAVAICTVSGSVVTVVRRWLAWDPNQTLPPSELVIARTGTGAFTWAFAQASYADSAGNPVNLVIDAVEAAACQADRGMIGTINGNGISGTLASATLVAGAAADVTRFIAKFY